MTEKPPIEPVLIHYGAERVPTRHGWAAMRCPFHDDRSASASVNTEAQAFKCHSCEYKGDAFSIVMMKEGVDFAGAREFLTELLQRVGIELPSTASGKPGRRKRKGVFEESGPVRGQLSFVAGVRRRPFSGA